MTAHMATFAQAYAETLQKNSGDQPGRHLDAASALGGGKGGSGGENGSAWMQHQQGSSAAPQLLDHSAQESELRQTRECVSHVHVASLFSSTSIATPTQSTSIISGVHHDYNCVCKFVRLSEHQSKCHAVDLLSAAVFVAALLLRRCQGRQLRFSQLLSGRGKHLVHGGRDV